MTLVTISSRSISPTKRPGLIWSLSPQGKPYEPQLGGHSPLRSSVLLLLLGRLIRYFSICLSHTSFTPSLFIVSPRSSFRHQSIYAPILQYIIPFSIWIWRSFIRRLPFYFDSMHLYLYHLASSNMTAHTLLHVAIYNFYYTSLKGLRPGTEVRRGMYCLLSPTLLQIEDRRGVFYCFYLKLHVIFGTMLRGGAKRRTLNMFSSGTFEMRDGEPPDLRR